MKAKEYAKEFFESIEGATSEEEIEKALQETVKAFIKEFTILLTERRIQTPRALVSAFKELQSKWVALCERMHTEAGNPLLIEDGLFKTLQKVYPRLWDLYQTSLSSVNVKKRMGWK